MPIVLGTFQSARNFGHWKVYHFRSRISTGIYGTLRIFTALLRSFLQQKMKCPFFGVRIAKCHKKGLPGQSSLKTIGNYGFPGIYIYIYTGYIWFMYIIDFLYMGYILGLFVGSRL